ncbi:MAG: enoyl-CoA hydratase/isomerase family protein [Candidatus Lokiarchaeota archaeon]|jgi:enoyl-CoA hydratase|nr:enoyl-CoA hydratase/isomerase family protein [Candidatus Lokiarchaeota archaeon]
MSDQELILYEVNGPLATITINRPDKAHAFNINMLQTMHSKLIEADEDELVKCILIKSVGERFFSAGYDLKEIQGAPEKISETTEWGRKVNETMLLIKKPIITQIKGIAVGFGVLMILASDLRIFADRPKEELYLRLPEIAISAFPQTGATLLPLLSFGLTYAKNMLFTADKAGLEELKNINFPTRIFPLDSIDLETKKFLKVLTKHQTEFLFFIKSMLTIMNKAYIKSCFDLEDECGKVAHAKKSMKELDDFIKDLHKKYP